MRRLDWYLLREVLGPMFLGFMVYTFLLLLQFLFSSADMVIQRGLDLATVGRMLALVLPSSVVLTIPMSLLFGILIAVGRLSSDSELVAMRSCGISLLSLYRPVLLLSGTLAVLNVWLMVDVLPHGNNRLQQLNLEILTTSVSKQVEPRVFYEEWDGKILYVFESPPGDPRWKGVFVANVDEHGLTNEVVVAEWGEVRVDNNGERVVLLLENATTHTANLEQPGSYNVSHHARLETVLEDGFTSNRRAKISASKSVREMDLAELLTRSRDPRSSPELRNLARVQLHKSFAIPAACLVFGLLALPLGFSNRRGGKASGFALSIGVLLVYWVMLSNGEEAARYGKLPAWFSMWMPNVLLTAIGIFLLVRRNRDKSLMLSRIDRFLREDLWAGLLRFQRWRDERPRQGQAGKPGRRAVVRIGAGRETPGDRRNGNRIVLRLPHLRLAFPNLMDRYVVQVFFRTMLLVAASVVTLYIVADLGEHIDEIMKNKVPRGVVFDYYKFLSLQIIYDVSPIVVLVTTLITFSVLTRTNEITALKASGISLFRLSVPAVVSALLVTGACVYLQSEVLPSTNQRVAQLKDRIKGREQARTYRRADRQWLFGEGRYVYNYTRYDAGRRELRNLQVFEFGDDFALTRRLYTQRARYQQGNTPEESYWIFEGGWKRAFDGLVIRGFEIFDGPRRSDYAETPDYFSSEIRPPEQMSYRELQKYIGELEERGQAVPELRVQLHSKISFPAISLIMCMVALPFAFRMGRQGTLYSVGLSVVLGMVFMAIYILFSTLGEAGALPPLLAVWSPNAVFGVFALYLFLGVRT